MNIRKILACALIGGISVSGFSSNGVKASDVDNTISVTAIKQDEKKQNEIMESLLLEMKSRITIPKEYSNFDVSYNDWMEHPTWDFVWSNKDGTKNIWMEVNNDGHILRYNLNDGAHTGLPKYLKTELENKAKKFLKSAEPDLYSHMKLKDVTYSGPYSNEYIYNFERQEYLSPVPENSMYVCVDAQSGEVVRFYTDWNYEGNFRKVSNEITKNVAVEVLKANLQMNLEYHLVENEAGYLGELVYAPDKTYLAVDVENLKVYDTKDESYYIESWDNKECATADTAFGITNAGVPLTEEEQIEVDQVAGLISKKDAEKKVRENGSFYIPYKATVVTASLVKTVLDDSKKDEKSYVWNMEFTGKNQMDDDCPYICVTMDAKTGEILSFYTSVNMKPWDEQLLSTIHYTEEDGKKIAQDYLAKYYPSMYKETKYTNCDQGYLLSINEEESIYGGRTYNYTRVKNGVLVPQNNISVSVDLVTGTIYRFDYQWNNNVVFESNKTIITEKKALSNYLSCDGINKVYEILPKEKESSETYPSRLVYRTDIQPNYIDAITGKQVDYDAKEMIPTTIPNYTDIEKTTYEKSIRILADMGVGFYHTKFEPSKDISRMEWNQWIEQLDYYDARNYSMTGNGKVTREAAARFAITSVGLSDIANLDIFKVEYADVKKIGKANIGYIVLAQQLGFIEKDKSMNIRPDEYLTREEAANLLFQMLCYTNKK